MIELALYQPDIPQNVGSAIRLCACLDVPMHVIEPCGFPWDEKKIRIAAMDYYDALDIKRHDSWDAFLLNAQLGHNKSIVPQMSQQMKNSSDIQKFARRTILLTTKTDQSYTDFTFQDGDILLLGRESAGVPEDVHNSADALVTIPMASGQRSLNVINAAAMVVGEALRQVRG